MEIKIKINTPEGAAQTYTETEKLSFGNYEKKAIRKLLLGKLKLKEEYTNKKKSIVYWVVEVTPKQYAELLKKVYKFEAIIELFTGNKTSQKAMKYLAKNPEDLKKVNQMLKFTKVSIVKQAEANEYSEEDQLTMWERIKKKFEKTTNPQNDDD